MIKTKNKKSGILADLSMASNLWLFCEHGSNTHLDVGRDFITCFLPYFHPSFVFPSCFSEAEDGQWSSCPPSRQVW